MARAAFVPGLMMSPITACTDEVIELPKAPRKLLRRFIVHLVDNEIARVQICYMNFGQSYAVDCRGRSPYRGRHVTEPSSIPPVSATIDNAASPSMHQKPILLPSKSIKASSHSVNPVGFTISPSQLRRIAAVSDLRKQPADAHHRRFAQPRAMGLKVSEEFTVPLCRTHHRDNHSFGDEVAGGSEELSIRSRRRGRYGFQLGPSTRLLSAFLNIPGDIDRADDDAVWKRAKRRTSAMVTMFEEGVPQALKGKTKPVTSLGALAVNGCEVSPASL